MTRNACTQAVLILVVALGCFGASAQDAPSPVQPTSLDSQVTVPFLVDDVHGNPAPRVASGDLSILDNGKPALSIVALHRGSELPLRLGVVIDKSNSQRKSEVYWAGLKSLPAFFKQAVNGGDDKAFVETFDTLPLPPTEWMSAEQLSHFTVDLVPDGGSSLFDAIDLACKSRMSDRQPARRVIVLLTDGGDNQSHIKLDEAFASAQRAGAVIFTVSTIEEGNNYQEHKTAGTLKKLADKTGGIAFLDLRPKEMPKVFSQIQEHLDSMYTVTYISEAGLPGAFHEIEIKAAAGKKLRIRAPKGFYGPASGDSGK